MLWQIVLGEVTFERHPQGWAVSKENMPQVKSDIGWN